MEKARLFRHFWLGIMLAAIIGFPLWKLISTRAEMNKACFTIIELQFAPLPAETHASVGGPLQRVAERAQKGAVRICTNEESYDKSTVEADWKRITLLKVRLNSPSNEIITAVPPSDRDPDEFYADAIHKKFLALRLRILQEIAFGEGVGVALAALSWCIGQCWLLRK